MRRTTPYLLALALIGGLAFSGTAQADPQPFELIRGLQQLQDHIAGGDTIAQAAHAREIDRTGRAFAKAPPATWSDPRNARALVTYMFSGGNASLIAATVSDKDVAPVHRTLYLGALAYGLGDDENARKQLLPIDARTLPSTVGAQLALVQATLCAETDSKHAIVLLDLARLIAPGTLIEEAALRKEMSLIGATGDLDKYGLLARRYLGAYARSAYADNFRQLVATAALQIGAADTEEAGHRIDKLVLSLEKVDRRKIYLAIAREALLSGRVKMAAMAGEEAGRLSQNVERDEARAMIYFGAAAIVGDKYELGQRALLSAPTDRLSSTDRALRTSALAVAEMIRRPPAEGEGGLEAQHAGVIADAEHSMEASEKTLRSVSE